MKIEHIAMYVKDLEKTKTFFEIYLNARANAGYYNPKTDFRSYFLSFDDGARLEIMNKPQMQDSPKALTQTGYIHIAFSVGSKEKVDELTAKLKEDGYEIISRSTDNRRRILRELRSGNRRQPDRDYCVAK